MANPAHPLGPLPLGILIACAVGVGLFACQDPAGVPPTLESGRVSFSLTGPAEWTFAAEGRCYWAPGYPAADSSCAFALDMGDTIRIRAARDVRTIRWVHLNVEFPENGDCTTVGACRIGFDYLNRVGKVSQSFRSTEATVTILEATEDRMRGTFSGSVYNELSSSADTFSVVDGTFDVPLER